LGHYLLPAYLVLLWTNNTLSSVFTPSSVDRSTYRQWILFGMAFLQLAMYAVHMKYYFVSGLIAWNSFKYFRPEQERYNSN
jgi:hypothetical protein